MEYINKVSLVGKIVRSPEYSHEFNGVPFYSIDLEIPRSGRRTSTVIRCYFKSNLLAAYELKLGMILSLNGSFINSKVKGVIDISVLVDEYDVLENYTDSEEEYEVEISGEVTKIFTTSDNYKGLVNFVVTQYNDEGKKSFSTRVIIWNRLAEHVFNNMAIGDNVIIKGSVNNSKTKSRIPDGSDEQPEELTVSEVLGTYFSKL